MIHKHSYELFFTFRVFLFPEDQQIKLEFYTELSQMKVKHFILLKHCFYYSYVIKINIKIFFENLTPDHEHNNLILTGSGQSSFQCFSPFWNFAPWPPEGSTVQLQVRHGCFRSSTPDPVLARDISISNDSSCSRHQNMIITSSKYL